MYICAHMATVYVWQSGDNWWDLILSFHQVVKLGGRHLYHLSHQAGPRDYS